MSTIFPIVEGHGDSVAVPILLRRLATEQLGSPELICLKPFRLPRTKLVRDDSLGRAVRFGILKLRDARAPKIILVLMDSDDDCPAHLSQSIRQDYRLLLEQGEVIIAFAVKEYENWFLAANLDQTHHRDLRATTPVYQDPDAVANAKSIFEREFLKPGRTYSETADQPKFTAIIDLAAAQRSPSFARLVARLRMKLIR